MEPRSVRPNEVFENLASRICPEKQRIGQGRSVREKSVRANDPIKMKKIKGAFSLNNLFVGTAKTVFGPSRTGPNSIHPPPPTSENTLLEVGGV